MWKKRLISCVLAASMISTSIPAFAQSSDSISLSNILSKTSTLSEIAQADSENSSFELNNNVDSINQKAIIEQPDAPNAPEAPANIVRGLAREKIEVSSEAEYTEKPPRTKQAAFDGDYSTRWASNANISPEDPETFQWIAIDMGEAKKFTKMKIYWEAAYGKTYTIQASAKTEDIALADINDWKDIYTEADGDGKEDIINIDTAQSARYLRIHVTKSGNSGWPAASIYEWEIYNLANEDRYIVDLGVSEVGNYLFPRYPKEDFTVPISVAHTPITDPATVTWTSNNSAIKIDNTTGKATVTIPTDKDANGTVVATISKGTERKEFTFNATVFMKTNEVIEYKIYPQPQKVTRSGGSIVVNNSVNIVKLDGVDENTVNRAKEVLTENGYTITESDTVKQGSTNLVLKVYQAGDENTYSIPKDALSKEEGGTFGEWNVFDAHVVKVADDGNIYVVGKHDDAVYYGLATVDQILEQKQAGNKLSSVTIEDWANSEYRGIIEGFYGFAFSEQEVESLFDFGKRYKMNTFIYGPKADPYHLGYWKEPYPTTLTDAERRNGMWTQEDMRNAAKTAEENNINFVWSIHPMMEGGVDITTDAGVAKGVQDILAKYEMMYDLGIKHFALFVDDISEGLAIQNSERQAKLIGDVTKGLKAAHPETFKPVFYVPTLYFLNNHTEEDSARNYGAVAALENFDDILFTFTGQDCWYSINNKEMTDIAKYLGNKQKPTLWWNSPVNDNMDNCLFVGPANARYEMYNDVKDSHSMLTVPMNQSEASKIHLFGSLDYSWNVSEFNAMENWKDSFAALFGDDTELSNAFEIFAQNASPNAPIGDNASVTYSGVDEIISQIKKTKDEAELTELKTSLYNKMVELKDACQYLRNNLKGNSNVKYATLYTDIEPWLNKCYTLADIYVRALELDFGTRTDLQTYYDAAYDYNRISISKEFQVASLEGYGTTTSEALNDVTVGGPSLLAFAATALTWAREKIEDKLPPVQPAISTSIVAYMDNATGVEFDQENSTIKGLNGKVLKPGQYVGVAFPELVDFSGIESTTTGLQLQYSSNGKTWFNYSEASKDETISAVRLINLTNSNITFTSDTITVNAAAMVAVTKQASQNGMGGGDKGYQGIHPIKNIADGDLTTQYFCVNSPKVDSYIQVEYVKPVKIQTLQFLFEVSNNLDEQAKVEISEDGQTWTRIATFNGDGIPSSIVEINGMKYQSFNIDGIDANVKYVRMTIEKILYAGYSNWMECFEIIPNGGQSVPLVNVLSGKGANGSIDSDVDSVYLPEEDKEGYLLYSLLDSNKINKFSTYMIPNENGTLPTVEIFTGKEWTPVSIAKDTEASIDYVYTIDISTLMNASQIKFSWTKDNVPKAFYDIYYTTMEDTITYLDKEALVKKYVEALSAKRSDYTNESWNTLKEAIAEALYVISSQSVKASIDNILTKLSDSIIPPRTDYGIGDIDNTPGISANDASIILQHILNPIEVEFSEAQKQAASVVDGESVTANDAAWIIKKVISGDNFKFPIEVKNENNAVA